MVLFRLSRLLQSIHQFRWGSAFGKALKAPIECCKVIEPDVKSGCPNEFTRTNSYFFDGCESNLRQYLHKHIPVIVYTSLCVLPLELILIAISLRTWFRARQVGKYESFSQESEQYAPNRTELKETQPAIEPEYDEI
ncbi:hypothetical protein CRM22_008305 [Opisthorchis felineus]|uniref:Uncharacterized protein n=1 Tax=Opisthorchis felineus TaxID=147828 RepID=A0A4S2LIT8_OPIFE|nr:hypothetical protein CRM22_008305 [Opisthorchis felineus]